jgi:hypothetical protein
MRLSFDGGRPMESEMRKRVLTVFGTSLIAALTIQADMAAARNARKAVHAPVATNQLRNAFGSMDRPSTAKPEVGERSCDIVWCYSD